MEYHDPRHETNPNPERLPDANRQVLKATNNATIPQLRRMLECANNNRRARNIRVTGVVWTSVYVPHAVSSRYREIDQDKPTYNIWHHLLPRTICYYGFVWQCMMMSERPSLERRPRPHMHGPFLNHSSCVTYVFEVRRVFNATKRFSCSLSAFGRTRRSLDKQPLLYTSDSAKQTIRTNVEMHDFSAFFVGSSWIP